MGTVMPVEFCGERERGEGERGEKKGGGGGCEQGVVLVARVWGALKGEGRGDVSKH